MVTRFKALPIFSLFALGFSVGCSSESSTSHPGESHDAANASDTSIEGDNDGGIDPDATVSSEDAAAPFSSRGSGGFSCERRDDLGNGRSACVVRAGSVELKIAEPPMRDAGGSNSPLHLGLYIHGDGAAAYKSGSALKKMIAWVDSAKGLAVAALAPNGCSWAQSPSHDCNGSTSTGDVNADNTKALGFAIDAIRAAYDIRNDAVYYYGSSGGSMFLTDQWLPIRGDRYPGIFALMCGGQAPTQSFTWDTTDAHLRDRDRLFFTYGDQDFLVPDIEASMKKLGERGFAIEKKIVSGAGHCAFDAHGEAMTVWTDHPTN